MSDVTILIPLFLSGILTGASLLAALYADKVAKAVRSASELELENKRLRKRVHELENDQ